MKGAILAVLLGLASQAQAMRISDGQIGSAKIADGAVTTAKLDNGAVTGTKLGTPWSCTSNGSKCTLTSQAAVDSPLQVEAGSPSNGRAMTLAVSGTSNNCLNFTENTVGDMDVCKAAGSDKLTVGGSVDASAQPVVFLTCNTGGSCNMKHATDTDVFWDTNQTGTNAAMHSVVTSSQNVVVPAGEGGRYLYNTKISAGALGSGGHLEIKLLKNGSTLIDHKFCASLPVGEHTHCPLTGIVVLAAGDTLSVKLNQNRSVAADYSLATLGFPENYFHVYKLP